MARSPAPKPTVISGPSKRQREIFASHGKNLDGSPVARQTTGGSGGKGGSKPSYDPQIEGDLLQRAQAKYNNDNSYGYYNDQGQYVDFFTDATDGGGMNTTNTYFQGGPFSAYLNALKVRPAGMARETNEAGEYLVPRADIGFRDATDMGDGGGPQAMGGPKMGLPISNIFNALDQLGGVDQGERVTYASMTPQELERRRAARGY
jgi:hypothetical protein